MTNQQGAPEALRLADYLNGMAQELEITHYTNDMEIAAAELRRLHSQVEALSAAQAELAAMRAMGEPALFVSALQFEALQDPDGAFGTYLPARKTLAGKFDKPLYTHPQPAAQDAERKPLDIESIKAAAREQFDGDDAEELGFRCGVRWAERSHGIAAQQGEKP